MSASKIIGLAFLTVSSCAPAESSESPPHQYAVPLFFTPSEEVHPQCRSETVQCNYYSEYGPVFAFKCLISQERPRIYISEKRFGEKLWYETRLKQNINNQTFSEYCKSTFDNYAQFRKETE